MSTQLHGPLYSCPSCKTKLDGATHAEHEDIQPQPGDLSVCTYCSCVLEFAENGLVPLTRAKFDALSADERNQLLRVAAGIAEFRREAGREAKPVAPEFHAVAFERKP